MDTQGRVMERLARLSNYKAYSDLFHSTAGGHKSHRLIKPLLYPTTNRKQVHHQSHRSLQPRLFTRPSQITLLLRTRGDDSQPSFL